MFLYYRRRRLRYYQGEEWPFPTLPANGRAGGRRRKEDKDYGETPEMYECLLDVKAGTSEDGAGDVWGGRPTGANNLGPHGIEDFSQWQPVTVKSLDTKAIPAGTTTQNAQDGAPGTNSSRPRSLFSRTLSTSRNMFTQNAVQSVSEPSSGSDSTAEKGISIFTSSNGTAQLPLSVTYLIAMPSTTVERRPSAIGIDDDEAGEEIPEVALGMTNVTLEIPGISLTSLGSADGEQSETTTKQRRTRKTNHVENAGQTATMRNSVVGQDGTLDLMALLQQGR